LTKNKKIAILALYLQVKYYIYIAENIFDKENTMIRKYFFITVIILVNATVFSQENSTWQEKELKFINFYATTGSVDYPDGTIKRFLENVSDELRNPLKIKIFYDLQTKWYKEIAMEFKTRGGEDVKIHLYLEEYNNGTYVLETFSPKYSFVIFKNCKGKFRYYPLENNTEIFQFVLYNEMGRNEDNIYIAFDIQSLLLGFEN
jgi:hypothetical protein